MLTSLIYFNQIEIIQYIQKNDGYTNALFKLYESEEDVNKQAKGDAKEDDSAIRKKRDGVRFVHQMSIVAKSFPLQQRALLYANFIRHGLFALIDFALKDELLSIRVLGSELIVTIIEQDPNLVRYTSERVIDEDNDTDNDGNNKENGINGGISLNGRKISPHNSTGSNKYNEKVINVFIDLLNNDEDLGLKSQATEALKVLLDVGGGNYSSNSSSSTSLNSLAIMGEDKEYGADGFEEQFYKKSAPRLFAKLTRLSSSSPEEATKELEAVNKTMSSIEGRASYEQLCDLLSFCIRQHRVPCRHFVISHNVWAGISRLIGVRHKQVRLAAIRCLKQGTLTDDIYYIRSICLSDALGSLLDVLIALGDQNNLIHSSCLELLTVIDSLSNQHAGHHPITTREIISHMVENYKPKLYKLKESDIAQSIINHYEEQRRQDELETPIPAGRMDSTMTEPDSRLESTIADDANSRFSFISHGPSHASGQSPSSAAAVAAAVAFGLVDYEEEEDDEKDSTLSTNGSKELLSANVDSSHETSGDYGSIDASIEHDNDKYDTSSTISTPPIPPVRLKRQSSGSEPRAAQKRRVTDENSSPVLEESASTPTKPTPEDTNTPTPASGAMSIDASDEETSTDPADQTPPKKKGGHLRRTLATAGKKLSVTFKRDKDKAVTSD
ncbi:Psy2p [Sugiyamaella lignohabitans]|uniref:Psy2p n=1 Tax=Sugiyamaella lignohabitans TaxID=796027 RepID=A0A167E448_9ASCO|nr:Psy2p [Sugiyamaella lignohabitans]ANB13620.1 Psy2p [Sugiyamaella lignohabitans]